MELLNPQQAHELVQKNPNALFIDCRSEMEFFFVGHPIGAHHVAWNDGPDWDINPHFVSEVKKLAGNGVHRPVVLICRSGNRSEFAAQALEQAGFGQVYNVLEGFEGELDGQHQRSTINGWRHAGLPWEQC